MVLVPQELNSSQCLVHKILELVLEKSARRGLSGMFRKEQVRKVPQRTWFCQVRGMEKGSSGDRPIHSRAIR